MKSSADSNRENMELSTVIKEELDRRLIRHNDSLTKYYSWEEVKTFLALCKEFNSNI